MSRGLGLHRTPEGAAWVLVERRSGAPPEVLAAGRTALRELPALHRRLAGDGLLPWGLAAAREGRRLEALEEDWPLLRPGTRALLHPAVAAAHWEYEHGRIGPEDLFLWLRPHRLLWSRGQPGRGRAGSLPRGAALGLLLDRILRSLEPAPPAAAAVAAEGDAPGTGQLLQELETRGLAVRRVAAPAGERGADRAAAGAALAALDPSLPGVHEPRTRRAGPPFPWAAALLATAAVGGSAWVTWQQERALARTGAARARPLARRTPSGATAAPAALEGLLARRRAFRQAVEEILAAAPRGRVAGFEILASPESSRARFRLRLLPGGPPGEESAWTESLEGRVENLSIEENRDRGLVVEGELPGEA